MNKIFLILLILSSKIVVAQTAATNTGILYIAGSSDIFFAGNDFTNASTAALTNNGSFYVKGNLSNAQASMAIGTGTLFLNGSSGQAVNGSQAFKTFNLNTNNSAGITLNNNLSVSGTHTFTSGMIASSITPNYLIYQAGSSYTGDADSKHVIGWVKKFGNTDFIFPVGDATYERTAAIVSLSVTSEFNAHYYTATQNVYNLQSPLVQTDAHEYWQIDQVSGGTASIAMNWNNAKVAFYNVLIGDIAVSNYIAAKWSDEGGTAAGVALGTGNITSKTLSSFGLFTFGFKSFPVPLKIISLTADRRSGVTYLHWITDNEKSVDHFDVQRSYDGSVYTVIGNTPARNSGTQENYYSEDHSSLSGIAYYRIRAVDVDGKFSYSKIVAVTDNNFQSSSFVVPNPVRSAITIFNKTGYDGTFDYRLLNAAGQLILTGRLSMTINSIGVLPLSSQSAPGIYLLELSNDKINFIQKILVEK